jgi:hypothetical protein
MPVQWEPFQSFGKLAAAVNSNDRATVRELVGGLVAYVHSHHDCYDPREAGDILNVLRRRRLFEEMRRAADAFLNNGCLSFKIRKYYAQALVDLGYLSAAEDVLTHLRADADAAFRNAALSPKERVDAEKEWTEACGLLGRISKDRYVNAHAPDVDRNRAALNEAINHYYGCYTADEKQMAERHWHGINAVALARRAAHDHVKVTTPFDVLGTAETILEEVKRNQQVNHSEIDIWTTANAMEASIALKRWQDAYYWGKEYAAHEYDAPGTSWAKKIDAFEVAGTLRQLEEVWLLNVNEEPGSLLLPLLRTRLQDLEGFEIKVGSEEPISSDFLSKQADGLERQFGGQFLSFRIYCEGVSRGRAVARIGPGSEDHFGTGFLIDGADLDPRLAGRRLLVTCEHVVSERNWSALTPRRAVVTFRADDNSIRRFGVDSVLWSSPEGQLDVSILRLDGDAGDLPVVPWAERALGPNEQRVLIFGHAVGGALSFSLGDNRLVDRNERYLQYRAPTVSGNSGSPVFNSDWELVAVHHRGGYSMKRLTGEGTHEANQGSSVFAVKEEIGKDPQHLFES